MIIELIYLIYFLLFFRGNFDFGNSIIKNTRNLESLIINGCYFDQNHLRLLTELSPDIEILWLNRSYEGFFGDNELNVLGRLKKLKELKISEHQIKEENKQKYRESFKKVIFE